eukprot:NODE_21_length_42443_cov_0.822808.p27 type:complete len:217 gc:universal NODE_21_length_42443_cov_0.822808:10937-11587(+)
MINRTYLTAFCLCSLGLLFVLIGQCLTISILGSFGIWITIVNIAYIGFLARVLMSGGLNDHKTIAMIVHTYCLSGMTFTSTIGLDVGGVAILSLVGSILDIIGMCILTFLLFSTKFSNLPLITKPDSNLVRNRDTNLTEFTDYSEEPGISPRDSYFGEERAVAKYGYDANPSDNTELSFSKGETLFVEVTDKNWWAATNNGGKKGIVPANYMILKK